jgi:hypothetical protein
MYIYYNEKLNLLGLKEPEWNYLLCKRLVYVQGAGSRKGYALVSELQEDNDNWVLITAL